ncbi:uncharacterized protein LOC107807847 isoform X1 [Nicotiana tabacum]|uniref:Uncharacterized protein LOC107807847 isoform X1 n=3 Tax=Nicotiana TaxID=4085 RepID=A0AC58UPV8_TOBAC|nr:PREDICTED: uncharacterized protein LOC104219518 [Nicotiana sylvestris]XP_009768515.1 PREDICTED: uncharacterized protein LOC104219518 [Nicotiana sylvestris]
MGVEIEEHSSGERLESERTITEILKDSRITYTKAFMLSLINLQICKELPKDFDSSVLRELDGASEYKLEMQQTSAVLPPYASNNSYIDPSTVIRCDLVAASRGSCGRWEKQCSRLNTQNSPQGSCDSDSRVQNDRSGILGSILSKSKNPYRPPQSYKVGNSNSYASHSSKETKSLANKACTAQEDVQLHNDTLQINVVGDKSSDVLATHRSKQIAKLSESQKSVDKFVDQEKSQCEAPDSKDAAIATSQQEHPDSDAKALKAINLEESERTQFGKTPEKEASLPHADFPGIATKCLRRPCTARRENGIRTVNILAEGSHENLKLNLESKDDFETEISNELLSDETFFPSQENSYERNLKTNQLEPYEFFLAPVLRNCGAFGTDCEGIRDSIFDCELELDEIEESTSLFDDFWTEILAVIHLEQESKVSYSADTDNITESEVPLRLPDEDELIFLNYEEGPKEPKIPPVDTSTDLDFVEDEIILPDEDSLISADNLTKHMVAKSWWKTDTADSADNSEDANCSEVTFAGRADKVMANFIADNTEHQEVAHCREKSSPPGVKVPSSPEFSSSVTHWKPCPNQIVSQTPCFHVNPEIPTLHPLDLYFTCSSFQNIREPKHVHYYPAVYWYPCSDIHHESSMKTTPANGKKYEYLKQYPMLHQPDNEQVIYDVVQQWDTVQLLPETYQQSHYPGFGFPI